MAKSKLITDWSQVPLFLDLCQMAMLLNLDSETVRLKCASGEIPAKKVGKFWRIEKNKFKVYMGVDTD